MDKYTVFKTPSSKYFVAVRVRNRTVFGGTFASRKEASRKARELQMQNRLRVRKIVCMY